METITCYLQGGLGNQLFILFTMLNYHLKYNFKIMLPYNNRISDRKFYWENFLSALKEYTLPISSDEITFSKFREKEMFEYNPIPIIKKSFCIFGYFQNFNYFHEYKNEILKFINFENQVEIVKKKYEFDYTNIISLHFRIGDAKINTGFIILEIEYYIKAINAILKKFEGKYNILYFYEKEDTILVNDKIKILVVNFPNLNFIPIDTTIEDYEQMVIMSLCKHNIIANSTFSWWGAYLNVNKDSVKVYPSKYFMNYNSHMEKNVFKLFLDSWIKII